MRRCLESIGEKICRERGHDFSRRIIEIEDRVLAEYRCSRCNSIYQENPTKEDMERYREQTEGLFV